MRGTFYAWQYVIEHSQETPLHWNFFQFTNKALFRRACNSANRNRTNIRTKKAFPANEEDSGFDFGRSYWVFFPQWYNNIMLSLKKNPDGRLAAPPVYWRTYSIWASKSDVYSRNKKKRLKSLNKMRYKQFGVFQSNRQITVVEASANTIIRITRNRDVRIQCWT